MNLETRIAALKTKLAVANFKKENPHLANDEYYHKADKSMTIRSFEAGADAMAEAHYLRGRVECLMWLRDKKVIQPHVVVDDAHKLEALLKQMEEKV